MAQIVDYIVPALLLAASAFALRKKENSYNILLDGANEGLKILLGLIPILILLLTAVTMLRASGAVEALSTLMTPLFRLFGSAALAVGTELMAHYGVDSQIGRTAAIMLGSTETTFYTISVYFGAAGIRKTRYTIPAALFADFTGFFVASLTARLFF